MNAQIKAYEEKARAELQKARTQLSEFEAREKAKDEQVFTDVIDQLKKSQQNVEKHLQALKTAADDDIQKEKADIDAGIAKLKKGLSELDTKLREPRTKAS